jgi:hypothetical protein
MSSAPILKHNPLINTTFDPPWFLLDNTFRRIVKTYLLCKIRYIQQNIFSAKKRLKLLSIPKLTKNNDISHNKYETSPEKRSKNYFLVEMYCSPYVLNKTLPIEVKFCFRHKNFFIVMIWLFIV